MSFASVELELAGGERHLLVPGDIIGRVWSAALQINDARVSECHALISLRDRELKLLALRGRFIVDGASATSVVLKPDLEVQLAPGLSLRVRAVNTPEDVLALEADGVASRVIPGVVSLFGKPRAAIRPGFTPDADAHLWPTGDGWMRTGDPPVPVEAGDAWTVGGVSFRASLRSLHQGVRPTEQISATSPPLRLIARYDTVHIHRDDRDVAVLTGRSARLVSELAILEQPIDRESLAVELWGPDDRDALRRRWDMQLRRLRQKLVAHNIRKDLVQSDGGGHIQLVLGPRDVVVDET